MILIRHGETDWNVERRSQGWNDQPLNIRGLEQATRLAAVVRQRFAPAKVWSSDLRRCMQTAQAIGLPVSTSKKLRELNLGKWEGRVWDEIEIKWPDLAARWLLGDPDCGPPGGEIRAAAARRAAQFLEESKILSAPGDQVVVAHGGLLKGLLVALLILPDHAMVRFHMSNAAVSIVETTNGVVQLKSLNDTSHLTAVPPSI